MQVDQLDYNLLVLLEHMTVQNLRQTLWKTRIIFCIAMLLVNDLLVEETSGPLLMLQCETFTIRHQVLLCFGCKLTHLCLAFAFTIRCLTNHY